MSPIRVAILGATGYGGGESLRLFLADPKVAVKYATSRTKAGVSVGNVHRNLAGLTPLSFSDPTRDELLENCDFIFAALPHGAAAETLAPLVDAGARVIDLSGDFRLRDAASYKKWYKKEHVRPDLLQTAVYGCPELNAGRIKDAKLVASPGCFATSMNLALLPVAKEGILHGTPDVVAMTGSSGSGAEAGEGTHHPTRALTLRPYKVLAHQHVPEVVQLLGDAGSKVDALAFTPVSAPLVRGILSITTAEVKSRLTTAEAVDIYKRFFSGSPYVKVMTDREPECAAIAGTNYVEIRPRVREDGKLHVACAIDNLLKGGAGQAVESFYLMTGRDQSEGPRPLDWMGSWP